MCIQKMVNAQSEHIYYHLVVGFIAYPAVFIVSSCTNYCKNDISSFTQFCFQLACNLYLDPRPEYHRCCIYWPPGEMVPEAVSTGNQISSRLVSMKGANGLIVLPPRTESLHELQKGDIVDVLVIGSI